MQLFVDNEDLRLLEDALCTELERAEYDVFTENEETRLEQMLVRVQELRDSH